MVARAVGSGGWKQHGSSGCRMQRQIQYLAVDLDQGVTYRKLEHVFTPEPV